MTRPASRSQRRDEVADRRQIGRCALEGLAADRNVATGAAVDFDFPAVDLDDAPSIQFAQTPQVQARAGRADLCEGGRRARQDPGRPRREVPILDTVIDIDADEPAFTVQDEAEPVANGGRMGRGIGCPRPRIRRAGGATRDGDGAFGIMPDPAVTVTEGGRDSSRGVVSVPSAVGGDTASPRAIERVGSSRAVEWLATVLACARVEHKSSVARIYNGCNRRDSVQDVTAKVRRGTAPLAARGIVPALLQCSGGGVWAGNRTYFRALRGEHRLSNYTRHATSFLPRPL